jgi:hypothetical protein
MPNPLCKGQGGISCALNAIGGGFAAEAVSILAGYHVPTPLRATFSPLSQPYIERSIEAAKPYQRFGHSVKVFPVGKTHVVDVRASVERIVGCQCMLRSAPTITSTISWRRARYR